jgi:hypothetical protein
MQLQPEGEVPDSTAGKHVLTNGGSLVADLRSLSGKEILAWILERENPREIVQRLPPVDFFWLVKKIGEEDCVPALELASVEQWQHLLDLEIWRKDRLHVERAFLWLQRLCQADPTRLARWLFSEGRDLASYCLCRSIQVAVRSEDEVYDLPDGFLSLGGGLHVRAINSEHQDTIENIIRAMAGEDFERCRALLQGPANLLPAEIEDDMYRLRGGRLAEHGFLPFEEALSVYAPLDPERIISEKTPESADMISDEEIRATIPVSPLYFARARDMLTETATRITDPLFLDSLRLEFAGLCNQILSADGLPVDDVEVLIKACRKAAGHINLALERLCGNSISSAEEFLRDHSLVSLFRVGFGLALKLKWEAEHWLKGSWFYRQGLDTGFWGDQWGATLAGVLQDKPQLYIGLREGAGSKGFESSGELDECRRILHRLMVLDRLLGRVAELYPVDEGIAQSTELTFRPLLFNLWARRFLKLEPCFSGISLDQAKGLFRRLRAGRNKPPYQMSGFEEAFVEDLMSYVSHFEGEAGAVLEETLSLIWREFHEEYEWVSLSDLSGRYSKFISITASPTATDRCS